MGIAKTVVAGDAQAEARRHGGGLAEGEPRAMLRQVAHHAFERAVALVERERSALENAMARLGAPVLEHRAVDAYGFPRDGFHFETPVPRWRTRCENRASKV